MTYNARMAQCWDKEAVKRRALRVATTAAREAGGFLLRNAGGRKSVTYKSSGIDIVTAMDRKSERIIVRKIAAAFPAHDIIGEEGTRRESRSPFRWYIDPIDGTTNYAHGFPVFCVSIGLEIDGRPEVGVVYNPNLGETFRAVRGGGAYRNSKKISVSRCADLGEGLLATGFPYDIKTNPDNNLDYFRSFAMSARAIRRAGSAALDLCYIACGAFDGFWEMKLKPWDYAAGALIAEEAGAIVTDFAGKRYANDGGEIVAGNKIIHRRMLRILRNVSRERQRRSVCGKAG